MKVVNNGGPDEILKDKKPAGLLTTKETQCDCRRKL